MEVAAIAAPQGPPEPPVEPEARGLVVPTVNPLPPKINPDIAQLDPDDERVKPDGGLIRHSRRTERLRKKQIKKQNKPSLEHRTVLDLPYELMLEILSYVYPSDLVRLSRANKSLYEFVVQQERILASHIIRWRYPCLEKCLRLPIFLEEVEPISRPALANPDRLGFLKRPYNHVKSPDPEMLCTCLTCQLRWNSLCLTVDFAHFQGHLDRGDPMPMIPRGRNPAWNQRLIKANAEVVSRAMHEPLWYACILEAHLKATVRSIKRHSENKGNRRRRFRMTKEDEQSGTDAFLERSGPPTVDFPFHRDNYYMLEAYLPNRGWNGDEGRWMYMDAGQHDADVAMTARWHRMRKEQEAARATQQSVP